VLLQALALLTVTTPYLAFLDSNAGAIQRTQACPAAVAMIAVPNWPNGLLSMHCTRWIQRLLFIVGVMLIGVYVTAYLHREIVSRVQISRFNVPRTTPVSEAKETALITPKFKIDFGHWSQRRIAEYEESLAAHFDPPLALLRISKVQLDVPVLEGTDDLTLNRGVGHIIGTARPGEDGNIGIAGHRDGFFRVLKDIGRGDSIELVTPRGTEKYTVNQIVLVRPNDVSVLQPGPIRSLTLVTCYPFYFIGSAPQRYIVQASTTVSDKAGSGELITKTMTSPNQRQEKSTVNPNVNRR
jgi:sortase A